MRPNLTRFINSITAKLTPVNGYGQYLQYAYVKSEGNSWPGSEPAQWERAEGSQNVTIESNGRLYARQYDPVYDQAGETVIMDFEKVTAAKIHIGEWPDVESNSLVQIDEPLKVMGCYMTRATTAGSVKTAYVYVVNSSGNPLKIVVSGEEAALRRRLQDLGYFSFGQTVDLMIPRGGVTGRLSKTVTDDERGLWPELLVTPSTGESYLNYLRAAANGQLNRTDGYYTDQDYADKEGDKWTSKPRTTIDVRRDFARYVELRSLEWLGANNRMRTDDGMELTLYNRLDVSATGYEFDTDTKRLVKGKFYKGTGYVGQLNGELALFPVTATLECPATPRLYAPNLIDGKPDDNGFIEARAISGSIRIVIEGAAGASFSYPYKMADSPVGLLQTSDFYASADGSFTVQLAEGETRYIAVYGHLNNMTSVRPAMVAITRYHAEPVGSIADFKKLERERRQAAGYDGSEKYYRLDGEAVIRMATPYYLYVSDPDDKADEQPADKYLLIYNENGWTNPQFADGGETRSLRAGDVIRDFALVGHDGMKLKGNIISNSTGFARTYKYAGRKVDPAAFEPTPVEINYVDPASDSYFGNVGFDEDQRMTYVQLRNVRVSRTGSSEADYAYTLDIKGDPALTFDVFPRTQGWHTMWKAREGFTITGVVVRDDKDGKPGYAFAPTAFEAASSVRGRLTIEFEGQGEEREGMQYFVEGDAVLSYTPAEGETFVPTIYYTLDGSDPRNNVEGRLKASGAGPVRVPLTADVVVRAFVAAPGLNPGAEESRTFRNSVSEVQYILNFLRAGREGIPYRFTSKLRIVASGGRYIFLAGPVGHFLPVYRDTEWDKSAYPAGSYLQHLLVEKRTDANGNVMAEATGYATPGAIAADEIAPGERISVSPDEVEELTVASARRLVTIRNVTVRAAAGGASAAPFMVTPLDGSHEHPLMDGTLGKVLIREADASGDLTDTDLGFADGEAYDITGFVMLGEPVEGAPEAGVELWPVSATHLTRTPPVSVSLQEALTLTMTAENEYMARFGDVAAVSISAGNVRGARIFYSFDNEEWFEYFRPIAVESSCMIHAKAVAPGMTESVHTHLTLEKATVSGDIEFTAVPAPEGGKTTVTLRAVNRVKPEAPYEIYFTVDGSAPTLASTRYTAPFDLTESSMVKAILVEEDMAPGSVGRAYITVAKVPDKPQQPDRPEQPSEPDPTVSGRVKFSLDDSDPAKVLVKIEPNGTAAPGYEIYYTTDAGKTFPDGWTKYDKPFDVTESTLVMAVLVENGKKPGVVAEVSVWVNPGITGIDGIGEDEAPKAVRVEGDTIVAPAGSRIYDTAGRQVRPEGLRKGIYIVVIPDGSSTKVLVK